MAWMLPAAMVASSLLGASSASSGASAQANAANRAADLQQQQYDQTRADQAPYREAGQTALNALIPLSTNYQKFGMDQFQQDPGYAFRLSEGQKALDRSAAARGGLISGGALKAAQRYGQDMGSQEYTNAFNRYQSERSAQLNPLQSLAGIGQSATNFVGQAGAQNAANVGNLMTGGAAAGAAGQMGVANALSGGLGQYMNYNQNQTQNSLLQQALSQQNNRNLINQYGAGNVYTPQGGGNTNLSWNGEI
jgi:hypothetical protein